MKTEVPYNEMLLFKGIRQVQAWIEQGKLISASNACTDLVVCYGTGICYDKEITDMYADVITKEKTDALITALNKKTE